MPFAALDFGTSNSTIGILQGGQPTLLEAEKIHGRGHATVPTALFFPRGKNAQPLIGRAAISTYLAEEPGRFMRGLKGVLGTSLFAETTSLNGVQTGFGEIIGMFVQQLIEVAQAQLQGPVTHLLVGRPVHFHTNQPEADAVAETQLRSLIQKLGIKHLAFLPEPLAAAYHHEQSLTAEQLALIVDIGGGTTDLTVMRLGPERSAKLDRTEDILATHGLRLGGTDIDQAFAMQHVMPQLGHGTLLTGDSGAKGLTVPASWYHQLTTWHRIHRMYEKSLLHEIRSVRHEAAQPHLLTRLLTLLENHHGHRLMFTVEDAKIALSEHPQTAIDLEWLEANLTLPLSQPQLAASIEGWNETLASAVTRTLQLAGIQAGQLSAIFLTGGPSAMPLVKHTITTLLPGVPLVQGNQLTSVGQGLTLAAARLFA